MEENKSNTIEIDVVIKEERTVKKEITLPYYSKTSSHEYYKVTGKGTYETMRVRYEKGNPNFTSVDNAFNFDKGSAAEQCTEEEFNEAFSEAQKALFLSANPTIEDERFKKPLLDFLEKQLKNCNEEDGESIIWWSRFINVIKTDLHKLSK